MIGPSGPLEKNLVIIFTFWPWNFRSANAKNKMVARHVSQSDCVRCRHHVGFKGPSFLVFGNRVVLFQYSCTMLNRLSADLLVSSFKSHWSAIPHILLGTWYTGILELGLLDYFIH